MRPSSRSKVNKHKSARAFRANTQRSKAVNVVSGPMRGGIRL